MGQDLHHDGEFIFFLNEEENSVSLEGNICSAVRNCNGALCEYL